MIYSQTWKLAEVIVPSSVSDGATVTGNVDTLGYRRCDLLWQIATGANTSDIPEVCNVTESDDATTYTAIVPLTGGAAVSTSVGFVIPNASASVRQFYKMSIDMRNRKRYLKCTLTPETTQINYVLAVLSEPDIMPDTTTEAGTVLTVNV